ncbi:MAG: hypothetical protein LUH01_09920, partial [Parabacteroides gordonii]|nr:hypothetical protein [Parabacteroides gordonii]
KKQNMAIKLFGNNEQTDKQQEESEAAPTTKQKDEQQENKQPNPVAELVKLTESILNNQTGILDKITKNEKLEDMLIERNSQIQRYQEDTYRKVTAPFIRQFISLADMMSTVMYEDEQEPKNETYWKGQFVEIIKSIRFILNDFSVANYTEGHDRSEFNPNRQEVISTIETDDETLDKKICRSLTPGYVWELPYIIRPKANGEKHPLKAYEFILRKERVETYKYNNSK